MPTGRFGIPAGRDRGNTGERPDEADHQFLADHRENPL
jgi:hypothetical protein